MALQEPVLRGVNLSFGWEQSPLFSDVRGALTKVLVAATEAGERWIWDRMDGEPVVMASNDERHLFTFLHPEGLEITSEHPDTDAVTAVAGSSVERCLDRMEIGELRRVGVGACWTLAAEQADQAEAALEEWLFSSRLRTTLGALGGRPDDLIVSARFEADNGVVTTLRTEPLTDEQAANGPFFISDMEASEFPPAMLFVRVEREHEARFGPAEGVERSTRVLQQVLGQGNKLIATLGGEDDRSGDPDVQER